MTRALINSRTRVLAGALALHRFTVAELAAFTDVNARSVKTVLDRDAEYFNVVGRVMTGRKGGQPDQYSLKPGHRHSLESALARLRGPTAPAPQTEEARPPAETSNADLRFLSASNAAREAILQIKKIKDGVEREELVARTSTQVAALQGVLRLATQSPSFATYERSWKELRDDWQTTVRSLETSEPPAADGPSDLLYKRATEVFQWLRFWNESFPCGATLVPYEGYIGIDRLLARDSGLPSPFSLLAPAASLALGNPHWSSEVREAVRQDIVGQLSSSTVLDSPQRLAALLACAAITKAQSALKAIYEITARSEFDKRLVNHERTVALLSIARLGHPRFAGAQEAALTAFGLLSRTTSYEQVAQYLLPAAIRDTNVNAFGLLDRFAQAVYGAHPMLSDEEERSVMQNLATSFSADSLHRLAQVIPELLSTEHGTRFVAALVSRRHEAIRLRGHDGLNFVVSPGFMLVRTGEMTVTEAQVDVDPHSEKGKTLNHLIWMNSATFETTQTSAPAEMFPDMDDGNAAMLQFQVMLQRTRRDQLLHGN